MKQFKYIINGNVYNVSVNQVEDTTAEVEVDYETAKIFDLFNQETQLNDKYAQAKKLIWECVKQLKADLGEFALDMTEDFTITATDCDLGNLQKNFIAINPELVSTYKGKI